MPSNSLVIINELAEIKVYQEAGVTAFLFALKDFSVGYPQTYDSADLRMIKVDKYLLINRLLDSNGVADLSKVLAGITDIKGLVYEDIAVYQLVNKLKLDLALIYFPNHGLCNQKAVAYWLDKGLNSIVLANELTLAEINVLTTTLPNQLSVHLFGYNQALYSRRLLLTNYAKRFDLDPKAELIIKEPITQAEFRVVENQWGSVLYYHKLYFGKDLLNNKNIKYFIINSTFLEPAFVIGIIQNNYQELIDSGFLYQPTIYKLPKEAEDE